MGFVINDLITEDDLKTIWDEIGECRDCKKCSGSPFLTARNIANHDGEFNYAELRMECNRCSRKTGWRRQPAQVAYAWNQGQVTLIERLKPFSSNDLKVLVYLIGLVGSFIAGYLVHFL